MDNCVKGLKEEEQVLLRAQQILAREEQRLQREIAATATATQAPAQQPPVGAVGVGVDKFVQRPASSSE